jgi:hypothetical protein
MKLTKAFVVTLPILAGAASTFAQPVTVQQLYLNQNNTQQQQMSAYGLRAGTNAPELYQNENEDVGPQHILRLNPRPEYFDVLLDSQVYYTDNANFAAKPQSIGSVVYLNTVQAALTPPAIDVGTGKLSATVGFASQWFNYNDRAMAPLDFDAQTILGGLKYTIGKWQANLGMNYTRLLSQPNDYSETYNELLPSGSLERFFVLNNTMVLALGDQVDYHFTHVPTIAFQPGDVNNHFDNIIFLTFNWQMTKHFTFQPFYRFQYSYYPKDTLAISDRNDYQNSLGLTLIYNFNQYFSARAYINYNNKRSSDPNTAEYNEWNSGVGLSLDWKF